MAKDKQVQRALAMLEEMRQKEIIPDLQSYNHCAGACKPKEWEEAVHILRTLMPKADIEPDAQSFEHEERRLEEERQKRLREAHGEPVRSAEKKEEKEEKQEKKVEKEKVAKVQNVTKAPSTEAEPPKPAETAPPEEREARTSAPEPREPREPREPQRQRPKRDPRKPKLRAPGSYVLPVFAQHDRSNHAERQALIKVIARVQEASGAQTDAEFEAECAEVTGTVRLYASHTPCISCMACFCQFQRLFPKVKLCVDFDDWRDTRRMVEMARREEEHKKRGTSPPNYDCPGLSDMSDEEEPVELDDMILKPASA
eukprot:g248.t1